MPNHTRKSRKSGRGAKSKSKSKSKSRASANASASTTKKPWSRTGGRKWSLKYKKSINCNRPRGFSQKQFCKYGSPRFNQSGGDVLNYLPSDMSMALREVGNSFSSVVNSVKGFAPAPSPLPFNDHKLQKTEVAVSERIPDIKMYYKNAMNLVPAL